MKLLVGLGNPGAKYASNRHNIGFMAADEIVRRHSFTPWREKFQGHFCEGKIDGEKCYLIKPMTYMNLSGQAVGEALRFYKIQSAQTIVFYDEIDLAPGKIRVKQGGGAAGHNGIKSIDQHIGNDFWRVRLGVGRPEHKAQVHNHVLSDFSKADQDWLDPLLDGVAAELPTLVSGDVSGYMTKVALKVNG